MGSYRGAGVAIPNADAIGGPWLALAYLCLRQTPSRCKENDDMIDCDPYQPRYRCLAA